MLTVMIANVYGALFSISFSCESIVHIRSLNQIKKNKSVRGVLIPICEGENGASVFCSFPKTDKRYQSCCFSRLVQMILNKNVISKTSLLFLLFSLSSLWQFPHKLLYNLQSILHSYFHSPVLIHSHSVRHLCRKQFHCWH